MSGSANFKPSPPHDSSTTFPPGGTRAAYVDAWEAVNPHEAGHTFTPVDPPVEAGGWTGESGRRIDYIFVKALEVVDCSLSFDKPVDGVWASDHFGVTADVQAAGTSTTLPWS